MTFSRRTLAALFAASALAACAGSSEPKPESPVKVNAAACRVDDLHPVGRPYQVDTYDFTFGAVFLNSRAVLSLKDLAEDGKDRAQLMYSYLKADTTAKCKPPEFTP